MPWLPDPDAPCGFSWKRPPRQPILFENDTFVVPTWNGLRAVDLELEQPPQDPAWRPV